MMQTEMPTIKQTEMLTDVIDVHTHTAGRPASVLSLAPEEVLRSSIMSPLQSAEAPLPLAEPLQQPSLAESQLSEAELKLSAKTLLQLSSESSQPLIPESQQLIPESQPLIPESQPLIPESQPLIPELQPLIPESQQLYSVSLHPWHVTRAMLEDFDRVVAQCAADPRWRAVGECGLDAACDTPIELQTEALIRSLSAARSLGKPTVIHCVRRWQELTAAVRRVWGQTGALAALQAGAPIIIHGYRKGLPLAQSLVAQGYCLSLGERFRPEVAQAIPLEQLYTETDESPEPIENIRKRILNLRSDTMLL
jgi:TatD DNase family protein